MPDYDHNEVRCAVMEDADLTYSLPGTPRTCCVCIGHDCEDAKASRARGCRSEQLEFRCTRPAVNRSGPGRTDLSARQGHYIMAATAHEARRIMGDRYPEDVAAGFGFDVERLTPLIWPYDRTVTPVDSDDITRYTVATLKD